MAAPVAPLLIGSAIASGVSSIFGAIGAGRAKREAERKEREARAEMERLKQAYKDLDTSNPFANLQNQFVGMENTMEDLNVNQQQARFKAQQFQQ